jgi:antitoxin component YwqK of YwqJK toxin-antitoxin module
MQMGKTISLMRNKTTGRFFQFVVLIMVCISCTSKPEIRIVEQSWPSGREKLVRFYVEKGGDKELSKEIRYYETGQKEQEGTFKKGERHGKWTYWYDNGNIWSEGDFKNGKSHGYRKVYHPNGKLFYEGNYKADLPVGKWKFFDEQGRFVKEENY